MVNPIPQKMVKTSSYCLRLGKGKIQREVFKKKPQNIPHIGDPWGIGGHLYLMIS
jgi:hypothetical protein